jgi:beta-barrel assembly-enhancing protease
MSGRRFLGWSLFALLFAQTACGGLLSAGVARLPKWGTRSHARLDSGFNLFSPEQDIELGSASAELVERQSNVLRDEKVNAYVSRIGERLAARAPGYHFPYKFVVVASPEINAFALPGGYIFVNAGAVAAAHDEGELAGVLAHEIAHVALRHGTNQATKAYIAKTGIGILDTITGGSRSEVGKSLDALAGTGANLLFLKLNRDAETQADLEGARMIAAAGYDPRDMANFFERLGDAGGERADDAPSDHPEPAARVAAINELITTLRLGPSPVRDTEEFRRIRARLVREL